LGVQLQDLDESLLLALDLEGVEDGVLVTEVIEDSPAERAGIERGDVLLRFDGGAVRSSRGLTRKVSRTDPETTVKIELVRKGERRTVDVVLGERDENTFVWDRDDASAPDALFFHSEDDGPSALRSLRFGMLGGPRLGARVEPMNEDLGRYFGTDEGLLVLSVEEDTPAEKAGLEIGDVIVRVDGQQITEVEDLREVLAEHEDGDEVSVEVQRDRRTEELTAVVEIPDRVEFSELHQMPGMRWFGSRDRDLRFAPAPHVERLHLGEESPELHRELDELREELERLRAELEEMRDQ
jgi:serine protease Do